MSNAQQRTRLTEEVKEQLNAMLPPSAKVTQVPWANMPLVCLRHSLWWEGIDANFRWEGVRLTSKQEVRALVSKLPLRCSDFLQVTYAHCYLRSRRWAQRMSRVNFVCAD